MRALSRFSPWVVFLVGGTVAALALHVFVPPRITLALDGGLVTNVLRRESDMRARPLTDAERAAVIAELEDQEVLLAEARRRGHLGRGYVYGRLLKKMRFLLSEDLTVPSDAELKAVYDQYPERFRRPGLDAAEPISFDEALPLLRGAWSVERQRAVIRQRTRELMSRYRVFVEDEE